MFEKISRAASESYRFFFIDLYSRNAIRHEMRKKDHGWLRGFGFSLITDLGSFLTSIPCMSLGCKLGTFDGAVIGGALGTLIFPGPGTTIGIMIGSVIGGVGGALLGWKVGQEVGGFVFSNIAKQTMRAISALFNFREANPTNPYKYKLTKNDSARIHECLFANEQQTASSRIDTKKAEDKVVECNQALAQCYQWKKNEVKPNFLSRVLGFTHFLFNERKAALNNEINDVVADLKYGKTKSYQALNSRMSRN